jgi:hypothetical protein
MLIWAFIIRVCRVPRKPVVVFVTVPIVAMWVLS